MKRKATPQNATLGKTPMESALSVLRTETALSRFPLHQLTRDKPIRIAMENSGNAVLWRVDYSSGYGPPGALAYKVDSLYVNRRIEESGRPVPKIIRLGSLREISQDLGLSTNTNMVKQALLQNASAFITAKLAYRSHEGGEKWLQAAFNRYSVVFTGELLPHGHTADAVHLVLNDIYQQILNTAIFRPLDYDYMKVLPPIAQRFYEIVSYQIYAALRHSNPRAKLMYSDYCLLSTATRYFDFDHVKKQMYKVLRPHVESGYIAKVEYEGLVNEKGEHDWAMYFTPGINADREYSSFTGLIRAAVPGDLLAQPTLPGLDFDASGEGPQATSPVEGPRRPVAARSGLDATQESSGGFEAQEGAFSEIDENEAENEPESGAGAQGLVERLVKADLNRLDAERFASEKPDVCLRQLKYLEHVAEFTSSRGAYLRRAIEGDYAPPAQYRLAQEVEREQARAERERSQGSAWDSAGAATEEARESHKEKFREAYWDYVREAAAQAEREAPEAAEEAEAQEATQRNALATGPFAGRPLNQKALAAFDHEHSRLERKRSFLRLQGFPILGFWEWDEKLNAHPLAKRITKPSP